MNDYEHFGDPTQGRCALHDNVEDVHEQAVKRAANEAMAKVRAENPELSEADLMVEVSDCVKQTEAVHRGRAAARLNEFPYEMLANQLVHRPGFPRVPPIGMADPPRYVDHFHDPPQDIRQALFYGVEDQGEEDRQVIPGLPPRYADPRPCLRLSQGVPS